MSAANQSICSSCSKAPECADRSIADNPVLSCEHFVAYAENHDLCSTCSYADKCTNRGTSGKPVFFCEEFYAFVTVKPTRFSHVPSRKAEKVTRSAGLCLDCEHRETCNTPKPESGVWHCEEYH